MNKSMYSSDISEMQSRVRVSNMLKSSNSKRSLSLDTSVIVGNDAKLEFLDTYLNLPLISERNKLEKLEDTPHAAYLGEIEKIHMRPQPFGIIRRKGPSTFIDIHMFSMGDTFAKAFSKGVKQYKEITNLNLKANRLTDGGCAKILSEIHTKKVKTINVSENKLGRISIEKIIEIVSINETRLRTLELESISISERAVYELCRILADNKVLHSLNLAKNNLGYIACTAIKEMFRYNSSIKNLDLHWNNIRTEGAIEFFEGLSQNDSLKVLDISWNCLGRDFSMETVKIIGKCLKIHPFLLHIDLSYNNLTYKECENLAELIKDNHNVLGLHMTGNEGFVDAKGFIHPSTASNGAIQQGHFFDRILDKSKYIKKHQHQNNCWICEKWIEMTFEWKTGDSNYEAKNVHLNCDKWTATPMKKQKNDVWTVTRVVPQGQIMFYFSNHMTAFISKSYPNLTLQISIPPCQPYKEISIVNYCKAKGQECNPKDLFDTKARVNFENPSSSLEYEKIPWSIPISIFSTYLLDTPELKTECFEFDWVNTKLANLIKDEIVRDELKNFLRTKYDPLLDAYKTLSALSGSEVFAIGSNAFNEFLGQCKILDNTFTLSDVGINWNVTNSKSDKNQLNNSGNGLCRYEFLEIMTRIAHDKFIRNKVTTNVVEAVAKLFAGNVEDVLNKHNTSLWREEFYMVEDVDYTLKAYKPLLEHVYKKYAAKEVIPGQKMSMNLSEFRSLCMEAKLINENFTSREVDICYSRAMITQSDYLNKSKHLEMSFVEFLEAISRAANEMNGKDLKSKIEGIVPNLLSICSPAFVQSYSYPNDETYFNLMYRVKQG
ncbi:hypothetical protein SteCoe_32825 [Stentor coeruleus]|uniref:Uncharacterized protein n=1 Tax=Stentor coeruleus TaxID=5963 RepID=A0A1R2AY50_9CILI|nr:hypothetical protein SteCoe_32825 [Stentor coeruleus]